MQTNATRPLWALLGKVDILVSPIVSLTARRAELANPSLELGGSKVIFPVRLLECQRLVCRDQATWRVLSADGSEVVAGHLPGAFPTLLPGASRVTLASQTQPAADFRVIVKTVKVYR